MVFQPFKQHVERWTKMSPMNVTLKAGVTCPLHSSSLLILTPALLGEHTIHGHFINLCAVVLLNITQDSNVVRFHKVDGNTFTAKPTWTTNPKIQYQAITRVRRTQQHNTCIQQQLMEKCISKTTHQSSNTIKTLEVRLNRPFPSCLVPRFKTKVHATPFNMKMYFPYKFTFIQIIFTWKFLYENSFWNRGKR